MSFRRGLEMKKLSARLHQVPRLIVAMTAMLVIAISGSATPITYQINRVVGAATVTGFIQTDGTIGVLSASNFLDWNLLLQYGTSTFDLTGPSSGGNSAIFVRGTDVEAFDSFLLFNFSGIDYGVLMFGQNLFSGHHYYCDSTQPYECIPGETVVPDSRRAGFQNAEYQGIVVIGNAVGPAPEPSTLNLICSGLALLMLKRKV
jgi:hypothetical protein